MEKITDVSNLTRAEIVPYYTYLIISNASDGEVKRMNDLILTKWKVSGLVYIKEKAWKSANALGYTFENAWGEKSLDEIYKTVRQFKESDLAIDRDKIKVEE
jgi:hypothetical protein